MFNWFKKDKSNKEKAETRPSEQESGDVIDEKVIKDDVSHDDLANPGLEPGQKILDASLSKDDQTVTDEHTDVHLNDNVEVSETLDSEPSDTIIAESQDESKSSAADEHKHETLAVDETLEEAHKSNFESPVSQIEKAESAAEQAISNADIQVSVESDISEMSESLEAQESVSTPIIETPLKQTSRSEEAPKEGLFARLKASLARTKTNIGSGFSTLLLGKSIDDDLYEELETQLLLADVGMTTTNKIIKELTDNAKRSELKNSEALSKVLQSQMQAILDKVNVPLDLSLSSSEEGKKMPFVILMVGVNGVGKTTTIGKLAKQFQAQGKSVMLAAGDTFRAAAVEQLQVWGERNNIQVVAQHTGADSASVIFDAIESAKSKHADILIADTAGRLQNKDNLIEELKKVVRVMKKLDPKAPHEIMLTLDASTGQNAVSQTRIFNEAVGITGINLTKLDGSAKGGVIFALADEFSIPVRYIGIGEGIDDLRPFDSKAFVDALFAE